MAASALLKFTQGATVGGDGRALVGVLTTTVAISNVNNASVASWQLEIAYVDPTSALAASPTIYAFNENSSTPSANFTPDVRRSYRWVLKVWSVPNRVGDPDSVDIRVFTVRELNGVIIPPSQVWPLPLPDPRTGDPTAKPLEMNFDGQLGGWHGTGADGLMSQILAKHLPPLPGSNGDVLTVVSGRWASAPPSGGGSGDVSGPASSIDNNIVLWDGTGGDQLKDSGLNLSAFIRHNGSVAFTANQSMGGFRITNASNAVASTDLVTLGQLQAAINGLDPKGNVRAYSSSNVALSGLGALGGVGSFTDNQRVGLGGQTNPVENGIWVVHAGAWTRPTDFAAGMDVSGAYFIVEEGTFADRAYLVTSDAGAAVVGTNSLALQDFGSSTVSAGNGLQKVGNVMSIAHDGGTLSSSGSGLKVATGGVTGTELAVGAVDLASTKVTGLLPFGNIANGAATSVLGRSASTVGVMASIATTTDGQVLRRAAGVLGFGAVDLADADAVTGLLPVASLATLAGLSVLGRSANSTGAMAAITGTADLVLAVNTAGTALAFGQVQTGGIANSAVTLTKLANGTAASVIGRSAATGGAYADIASSADGQTLRRAAGVVGWGALDLSDPDAVTGLLPAANITNGSANSVFGRASGTAGAMASIAATADGQTLRMAAGSLSFGALDLADPDAVTGLLAFANLASLTGLSVLGRAPNTLGAMAAITAANDGEVLQRSGTSLVFASIATAGLADNSVTMAKLADLAGLSVIGRSANTTGDPAAITATATGQILRYAGTTLAFGALDLSDADAVSNQLPGSYVIPNFVAQTVITTGSYRAGTAPATTGAYNLANSTDIRGRNAANNADRIMLRIDTSDTVSVGDVAATGIRMTTAGVVGFRVAGNDVASFSASQLTMNSPLIEFALGVGASAVGMATDATAAAAGLGLTVKGQDVSGTGSTVGGTTTVRGGNSTNGVGGALALRTGTGLTATQAGAFSAEIGTVPFFVYPGTVVPAGTGILRAHHNATVIAGRNQANSANRNLLRWGTTANDVMVLGDTTFASILLGDDVTVGNTADTWMLVNGTANTITFGSGAATQAVIGSTYLSIGSAPASAGKLRLPNGDAAGDGLYFRNAANSADLRALSANSSNGIVFGDSAGASVLTAGNSSVLIRPVGTDRVQITDTVFEWRMASVRFDVAVASPSISQEIDTTAAAIGDLLTITAQDTSGTGSTMGGSLFVRAGDALNGTGGNVDLRSGEGLTTTQAGAFTLRVGGTTFLHMLGTTPIALTGTLRFPSGGSIAARNNANTADVQMLSCNPGDGIFVGDTATAVSLSLQTMGARLIMGTNLEIQNASQLRFDSAVASPSFTQEADATTGVTGGLFQIQAQSVTGTGATVGGSMRLRGGDSTNGTGGALDLRSGAGVNVTSAGAVQLRIGATLIFNYPGTVVPSSSGGSILRAYHNAEILSARDSANTANALLMRWGVTATNTLTVGSTSYDTEILGSNVEVGDGSTYLEVAVLATNREILSLMLGADLSTSQMPANTGDKVAFLASATTPPANGANGKPIGGSIFYNTSALGGMSMGEGGAESTFMPRGSTTTKARKFVGVKKQGNVTTVGTGAEQVICSFSMSDINSVATSADGTLMLSAKGVARRDSLSSYIWLVDIRAAIVISASGFATVLSGSVEAIYGALSDPDPNTPTWNVVVVGSELRLVITPKVSDALICFGVMQLDGDTDS